MGVPAFFAWLCRKYPQVLTDLSQHGDAAAAGGHETVDETAATILAGWRCDNLYLDMNGIIHPCCHPEGGAPQPKDEAEMFENVTKLLDSLVLQPLQSMQQIQTSVGMVARITSPCSKYRLSFGMMARITSPTCAGPAHAAAARAVPCDRRRGPAGQDEPAARPALPVAGQPMQQTQTITDMIGPNHLVRGPGQSMQSNGAKYRLSLA